MSRRSEPIHKARPGPKEKRTQLLDRIGADPSFALLPLRAFLGVTFCFAGLQKLANPNFFRLASPISINSQLIAAERTSPLHGLLGHLLQVSTPLGVMIAASELAIGLGILAGVLPRIAAVGGMALSLGLFLTVSFHSNPYYTGADIGYFFAFTPLLIAGVGHNLTLEAAMESLADRYQPRPGRYRAVDEERRRFLAAGALGAAGLAAAGLAVTVGRLLGSAKPPQTQRTLSGPKPSQSSSPTSVATRTPTTTSVATPLGSKVGPASAVPVGGAASFQDPASGDPAVVIQAEAGKFVAFDAVCPHAGCTVSYSQPQAILVCPCHGSLFNAATGAVETGPASTGLRTIHISQGPDGQLYVV